MVMEYDTTKGVRQGGVEAPRLWKYAMRYVLAICSAATDEGCPFRIDGVECRFSSWVDNVCTLARSHGDMVTRATAIMKVLGEHGMRLKDSFVASHLLFVVLLTFLLFLSL